MSASEPKSDQRDSLALLGRLQAACASDTAASIMTAQMSLSCAGRLRSASLDGLIVEIPNPPATERTILGCATAVSFSIGSKMAGFVADITALNTTADGALLATLALPQLLQVRERRSAVRIPVPNGSLRASLLRQGGSDVVRAVDISLTGILVELAEGQPETLTVDGSVTLSLTLGDDELVVTAVVSRRDGRRFGLHYQTRGRPPNGLTRMIYEIQQARRPSR